MSGSRLARMIGVTSVLLLAAVLLALLSMRVQRRGPEEVAYGNLCGPTMSDLCYKPALKGGFPIAYLVDAPGVSVEDQLSFGEDHFRAREFALDVVIYFALLLTAGVMARRSLARRERTHHP